MNHTEQRKRLRAIFAGKECLSPASVFDPDRRARSFEFRVLKAMGIYRSKPEDEVSGLDLPEMGMHAYPPQIVSESEILARA